MSDERSVLSGDPNLRFQKEWLTIMMEGPQGEYPSKTSMHEMLDHLLFTF